jgi:uncharacterized protein YbjT (DUF2867 family)
MTVMTNIDEINPGTYLVVGATAHFGRQTVEELAGAGVPVRALTRTPEKAGLPKHVVVAQWTADHKADFSS